MNGNEYFDYLHETNGIYLANSLTSDFNGPNEKSFQIAYAINMAEYGVPGLKFNALLGSRLGHRRYPLHRQR